MSRPAERTLSIGEIYDLRAPERNEARDNEHFSFLTDFVSLGEPNLSLNTGEHEATLRQNTFSDSTASRKVRRLSRNQIEKNSTSNEGASGTPGNRKRPNWTQLYPETSLQLVRMAGHCMLSWSNRIYVFGGYISQQIQGQRYLQHYNTLLEYNYTTGDWCTLFSGDRGGVLKPEPRRHATMVFHGKSLYVFGGFNDKDEVLGDLWSFDLLRREWYQITPQPGAHWPVARAEHSAVVDKDRMIVFGGYDGRKKLGDTAVLSFSTFQWTAVCNDAGYSPNRRCKHSAVIFRNRMFILGGFQFANNRNAAFTDLASLDLETMRWNVEFMNGSCPDGLQAHRAVVIGESMYVLGGKIRMASSTGTSSQSSLNNTVFRYRFDVNQWSMVTYEGPAPKVRQLFGACVVTNLLGKPSIVIHGGVDLLKETYYGDWWELQGLEKDNGFMCQSCEAFSRLLYSELFSDVVLRVDGFNIPAHRCILYARSEYFKRMLESDMKESREESIDIQGISHTTFLVVLSFIYSGQLTQTLEADKLIELLVAADMFGLDELGILCMNKLEESVTVENVSSVCQLAHFFNAEQLTTFCIDFIVKYFSQVVETSGFVELLKREANGLGKEILKKTCTNLHEISKYELKSIHRKKNT